jgi:hypothetical protein
MYTMVMMMAVSSGGDAVAFGRNRGCDGGCTGTVVATAPVSYGCTGSTWGAGCTGSTWGGSSCTGSTNCNGGRGGFLGLRNGGGLFGGRGCNGSSSCHGAAVSSCHGAVLSSCHGATLGGSCHGGGVVYSTPVVSGGCFGSAPAVMTGCVPTMGVVGGPVMMPPQGMPTDPTKKPEEPKKDETKKEEKKQD